MTTNTKQFMSVFALSAAALFLGGCKKPEPIVEPETTANPEGGIDAGAEGDIAAEEPPGSPDDQVKCFGINSCKGESICAVNKPELGIEHACNGENDCKGKGWIKVTRSDCEAQSGEVLGVLDG